MGTLWILAVAVLGLCLGKESAFLFLLSHCVFKSSVSSPNNRAILVSKIQQYFECLFGFQGGYSDFHLALRLNSPSNRMIEMSP